MVVVDVVILCLFDGLVKDVVVLVEGLDVCFIDVLIVYCVDFDWVFGFVELMLDVCIVIVGVKYLFNFGCYFIGVIVLLVLLVKVGLIVLDEVLLINVVLGYIGGGKELIGEYDWGEVFVVFVYVLV